MQPGCGVAHASEASMYLKSHLATEAALASPRELRQGSGGVAPSGFQGRSPDGGLGGRSPPEIFDKIEVIWCNFSNTEMDKKVKNCYHNFADLDHILHGRGTVITTGKICKFSLF